MFEWGRCAEYRQGKRKQKLNLHPSIQSSEARKPVSNMKRVLRWTPTQPRPNRSIIEKPKEKGPNWISYSARFLLRLLQTYGCSWTNSWDVSISGWRRKSPSSRSFRIFFEDGPSSSSITASLSTRWPEAYSWGTRSRSKSACPFNWHRPFEILV